MLLAFIFWRKHFLIWFKLPLFDRSSFWVLISLFTVIGKFHHQFFITWQFIENFLFFLLLNSFILIYSTAVNHLFVLRLNMRLSITFTILTIFTFALISTGYSSLKAFTIFLLAMRSFTFAAFVMFTFIFENLGFKSKVISLKNFSNRCLPFFFVFNVVVTGIWNVLFVTLTFWPASGFVSQAFAIELKTLCIFASASRALVYNRLRAIVLIKQLLLSQCFINDFDSHLFDFLFILNHQSFFLLG
mgnify:CR=1 FL=1